MSTTLWDRGVFISTHAGPVRADGGSRKRVQIVAGADPALEHQSLDGVLSLSMEQWRELARAVVKLGPDCEGEEI